MEEESETEFVKSAIKIIDEIKLTPNMIEKYEDCEIISDLIDEDVLKLIDDKELREILVKMRSLHSDVRQNNYVAYIDVAKRLFKKIPNKNYVLKYHTLERLSSKISDDVIIKIKDKNIRNTLVKVKHIHDNIAEKKANVIRQIKMH